MIQGNITLHLRWPTAENSVLPESVDERLFSYLRRYADTLRLRILAIGGADDHLHLLATLLRSDMLLTTTVSELQRASRGFLRGTLTVSDFAWAENSFAESVSPGDISSLSDYIQDNRQHHAQNRIENGWEDVDVSGAADANDTPDWLRDAMAAPTTTPR